MTVARPAVSHHDALLMFGWHGRFESEVRLARDIDNVETLLVVTKVGDVYSLYSEYCYSQFYSQ